MTEQLALDHLVYGVPDLAMANSDFDKRLGLAPVFGGRHEGLGTHNAILRLKDETYLELIASDLDGPTAKQPRPFRLDALRSPRLVAWAVRSPDIETDVERARLRGDEKPGPGCRLSAFSATHPDPESVLAALAALGARLDIQPGTSSSLNACLTGPAGSIELDRTD